MLIQLSFLSYLISSLIASQILSEFAYTNQEKHYEIHLEYIMLVVV
jgi:hypothetical protein